jgi:hypothetical protein
VSYNGTTWTVQVRPGKRTLYWSLSQWPWVTLRQLAMDLAWRNQLAREEEQLTYSGGGYLHG